MKQDGGWFDSMYNNRALVPGFAKHLDAWAERSEIARREGSPALDVRYGDAEGEALDVFPAARKEPGSRGQGQAGANPGHGGAAQAGAPVLVFIHGGYWRALDKRDHAFVAPPFVQAGACVVLTNYALCPAIDIPGIVMQQVRALAWVWCNIARFGGDPARIVVVGHSAGGHLAAMMQACRWDAFDAGLPANMVRSAISISGLHDLEPIMHTPFLQPDLRLTKEQVLRASPVHVAAPAHGKLLCVTGSEESAEYHRQNALLQQRWGKQRVPVAELLPGRNHFSALEALVEPDHALHRMALDLLRD